MLKFCKKCTVDTERNARGDCKPCALAYQTRVRAATVKAEKPDSVKRPSQAVRVARMRKNNPSWSKSKAVEWVLLHEYVPPDLAAAEELLLEGLV